MLGSGRRETEREPAVSPVARVAGRMSIGQVDEAMLMPARLCQASFEESDAAQVAGVASSAGSGQARQSAGRITFQSIHIQ